MCSRGRSNEPMVSVKYEEFLNWISVLLISELALSSFCEFITREISSSHGGEYDVQSCVLGYTVV
jgi:hypothetical protein